MIAPSLIKSKHILTRTRKLQAGEGFNIYHMEITINIPFTYEVGEEGPVTGNPIINMGHAMEEVYAEIESGWPHGCRPMLVPEEGKSKWVDVQDIENFDPEKDLVKPALVELFRPEWALPTGGITYGIWAYIGREATVNGTPWKKIKNNWEINRIMLFDHHQNFLEQHNL